MLAERLAVTDRDRKFVLAVATSQDLNVKLCMTSSLYDFIYGLIPRISYLVEVFDISGFSERYLPSFWNPRGEHVRRASAESKDVN
jgi:hypothetical protein